MSEGTQATARVNINDTTPAPRPNTRSRSGGGGGYMIPVQQTNRPPVFTEGANTRRSIAEDAANPANLGSPVSATDPDGDTLTYTLEGPDAASFSLNSANGQLAIAVSLDYETKVAHYLIMKVYDGRGGSDTTVVTVRVTDVVEQEVVVEVPVLTAQTQLVETLAPEPTPTPTPTPTPEPTPTPTPTLRAYAYANSDAHSNAYADAHSDAGAVADSGADSAAVVVPVAVAWVHLDTDAFAHGDAGTDGDEGTDADEGTHHCPGLVRRFSAGNVHAVPGWRASGRLPVHECQILGFSAARGRPPSTHLAPHPDGHRHSDDGRIRRNAHIRWA